MKTPKAKRLMAEYRLLEELEKDFSRDGRAIKEVFFSGKKFSPKRLLDEEVGKDLMRYLSREYRFGHADIPAWEDVPGEVSDLIEKSIADITLDDYWVSRIEVWEDANDRKLTPEERKFLWEKDKEMVIKSLHMMKNLCMSEIDEVIKKAEDKYKATKRPL